MAFLSKIFGDPNERVLKELQPLVEKINSLEPEFEKLSNDELKNKTGEFKEKLKQGKTLDDILPEAFALCREAAKRTLGQRHFDVQLIGGIVLHQGKITEMKTGEGKTLASTLALYLNALERKGAHLVTVNDYLARRDTVWMGQIYHALGLSVGCIAHDAAYLYDPTYQEKNSKSEILNPKQIPNSKSQIPNGKRDTERDLVGGFKVIESYLRPVSRKEVYEADITYGTNNEFGFDYLRDNMAYSLDDKVQGEFTLLEVNELKEKAKNNKPPTGFNYAIVDEVDSILIDEARTPLIISAPDVDSTKLYEEFARIVPRLKENIDYNIDEKMKAVTLTEEGIEKVENILGLGNIYVEGGIRYVHHLEQALRAEVLFKKDRDYVVKDGQIIIVDEFTGRLLPGRRYSEGLHQAIEAKEGVRVQRESRTLATITFQNYFRLYKKLAGMTGTAATNAEEFHKVYGLEVVIIPTNRPMIRQDGADAIYKTERGKFQAIVREIKERNKKGQPVLVGTISIEKNEYLSRLLEREGVPHKVLNAKHHEQEGAIIAQAGKLGAVTIATNMAGRGVDIILGGNPPDAKEALKVKEQGGLLVIGTERHEARRIDNQLRGRAGRQGDQGSSQFFISLEDELMRIFGGDRVKFLMEKLGLPEDQPIAHNLISGAIEQAQAKIEGFNFDTRKHLLEYDDVLNKHREIIYKKRGELLKIEDCRTQIIEMLENELKKIVEFHTASEYADDWSCEEICENFKTIFPMPQDAHSKISEIMDGVKRKKEGHSMVRLEILNYFLNLAKENLEKKEREFGAEVMRKVEKMAMLRTLDMLWMDHLENLDYLKDSVRLQAYGHKDPLVEYKNEAHKMFKDLLRAFQSEVVGVIYKIGVIIQPSMRVDTPHQSLRHDAGQAKQRKYKKKVGRNDPCPCGSVNPITGKIYKYKHCGLINAPHHKKI
ncbi:MAG: preprotein translocase subunit SecA [Parcubacteria group bacterium CG11_big_fil_rev_8_21_14_0_20_39_14]|nr:MAG: preprotein translocase subunit SecA [Parcubacteria group bacterium CG11_big_fil_rev_8_21_14_0_20_39_14]PIS35569.1 MAG: preprotein translocase subunit SecA [Parcubacteria group bacterium CG08_land_8_20_14_0_20_38_56]